MFSQLKIRGVEGGGGGMADLLHMSSLLQGACNYVHVNRNYMYMFLTFVHVSYSGV